MSGGSQHNPNGRQSQLGPGWSPLQLQMANLLARGPQVHMAPDRGVTWHTPTPPPHLYHVPAPSPPDPLQAMKNAGANSVFRHTATPPELYRHTPTPPDKHLMRHTPSPGDMKASAALPPADLYPHLGTARDKLVRAEELLAYARVGVDLSLSSSRSANGSAGAPGGGGGGAHPAPAGGAGGPGGGAGGPSPALSVRDAPTINSLIARAAPRHPHTRVDALLERLGPAPVSPHSVIVHSRAQPTPSPPSSNEDSADSCGAPPGSKRKRKPERVVRVPSAPPPPAPSEPPRPIAPPPPVQPPSPPPQKTPPPAPTAPPAPVENGDAVHAKLNGPEQSPPSPAPHSRRKTRSGSAETIADIAAMIADTGPTTPIPAPAPPIDAATAVATLESVLASPEPVVEPAEPTPPPPPVKCDAEPAKDEQTQDPVSAPQAAAPRRRSTRTSNSEATNVPVESPSEAKPAEPEASEARSAEPTAASFVEVENQLEKMFAGLEEQPSNAEVTDTVPESRKRRRSAPARGDRAARGRDDRRKAQRKKDVVRARKLPKEPVVKDAYDSGSNASSSRSRGPYIQQKLQIRGARDSPVSVSVMNSWTGEEEVEGVRRKGEDFGAARRARGLHASTLGLRYDATTPDATWLCAFCHTGPHAHHQGDLFGPYTLDTDCEEYRSLDEVTRRRYTAENSNEVWFHEGCAVWAPGLVAAGARVWGLAGAVWGARGARCGACARPGAALACPARGCRARTHLPCARAGDEAARWTLCDDTFAATCPRHA